MAKRLILGGTWLGFLRRFLLCGGFLHSLALDFGEDFLRQCRFVLQRLAGGFLALADHLAIELQPRTFFLDDLLGQADGDQVFFGVRRRRLRDGTLREDFFFDERR